jgi:hypothetical protein
MDSKFYGKKNPGLSRRQILEVYGAYCDRVVEAKEASRVQVLKPVLALFAGEHGGRTFRRAIDDTLHKGEKKDLKVSEVLRIAMKTLEDRLLDEVPEDREGEGEERKL